MQLGIYIHFPYCLSKCPYCDFASRAEAVIPQQRYTEAVLRELRSRAAQFAHPAREVVSIYFGGGTPSLWDPPQVGSVLSACRDLFAVREDTEVTLEANPGTTDEGRFTAFRALGVNRLSIGVQSFADSQLAVLGRKHSAAEAERAFRTARASGFTNISLDLIHGGSGQSTGGASRDAASAVALRPEHVSAYALTLTGLAEDVPMAKAVRRGDMVLPSDDEQASMGEAVRAELSRGGYARYEISNFARSGFESVHNNLYWRGVEYVAAGCGACGFLRLDRSESGVAPADGRAPAEERRARAGERRARAGEQGAAGEQRTAGERRAPGEQRAGTEAFARRYMNDRSPERYLERVEQTGIGEASAEEIDREQHLRERIFTGLRLAEGIDLRMLEEDLGLEIRSRFANVLERLASERLATLEGARLRLTDRGLDLHSEVAVRFF